MKPLLLAIVGVAGMLAGCAGPMPAPPGSPDAQPPTVATGCDRAALQQAVLRRVNEARTSARACGLATAAPALRWSATLGTAAQRQAEDMARKDYFDRRGPDGTRFEDRVRAAGYAGSVDTAVAAGDYTPDGVANVWLGSPAQCRSLLDPASHEIGAACASRAGTSWGSYWTMAVGSGTDGTKAAGAAAAPKQAPAARAKKTPRKAPARKTCVPGKPGKTCR